jgi:phosphatidylglycerophosphatase A
MNGAPGRDPLWAFAAWFGAGYLRPAPGTWGTLAALPFAWALDERAGFAGLALGTVAVFLLGWYCAHKLTGPDEPDPSSFVADEVAGVWLALWPVSLGAEMAGVDALRLWPGIVAAVLAFRLFDIWKPGPVGWADRMHSPLGLMLDDLIAGFLAALVVVALAAAAHGWLM